MLQMQHPNVTLQRFVLPQFLGRQDSVELCVVPQTYPVASAMAVAHQT
jgi:hypothetical protein